MRWFDGGFSNGEEERIERGVRNFERRGRGVSGKEGVATVPRAWRFQKKKEGRLEKMNMMGGPGVVVGERGRLRGLLPGLVALGQPSWTATLFFYSDSFSYFLFSCFVL
jgi:hypothetical protein